MTVRRDALRVGLVASAVALFGRGTARAADALTIGPDGATIFAKRINFGDRYGEFLAFWSPLSVGVQDNTLYQRSSVNFAWYKNGKHSDALLDPGEGGTKMMSLTDGTLTVSDKFVAMGAATLKTSLTVEGTSTLRKSLTVEGSLKFGSRLGELVSLWSSGETHYAIGIQHGTSYARSAGHFAWYLGGVHNDTALDPGGGRKMMSLTDGTLTVERNVQIGALSVPGGVETLRMIRGIINSNGTKFAGDGFSVSRFKEGVFDIAFAQGFSSVPGASATQIYAKDGKTPVFSGNAGATLEEGDTRDNAIIVQLSADRMRVATGDSGGSRKDRWFSFIVIGQR
jgi:hypothetical protein